MFCLPAETHYGIILPMKHVPSGEFQIRNNIVLTVTVCITYVQGTYITSYHINISIIEVYSHASLF